LPEQIQREKQNSPHRASRFCVSSLYRKGAHENFTYVCADLIAAAIFSSTACTQTADDKTTAKQSTDDPQMPKSISESVAGTLEYTEGNLLGVADAMPEDKYLFVPTSGNFAGARSFGEQIKHVACAQFAFFNEFEGKKPPDDCEKGGHYPAETKSELIKYLKDSFDYGNRVLATLTPQNALDRVEGHYAGPNTKLGISAVAVWHITDHYGQIVEYMRMNGIVPPETQKYGLKVR
jgi:uncharacterized damage-inducible protein DinB